MVTAADQYKVVGLYDLLIGVIFNDLENFKPKFQGHDTLNKLNYSP